MRLGNHSGLRDGLIPVWPPASPARLFRAYLSFLPPQLLQLIPSPPEPQGHKLTPADQAWAPPDPQGRVGAKGPLLVLLPMAQVDLQLPAVTAGIPEVPPKWTPGMDAFAKGERVSGDWGMLEYGWALAIVYKEGQRGAKLVPRSGQAGMTPGSLGVSCNCLSPGESVVPVLGLLGASQLGSPPINPAALRSHLNLTIKDACVGRLANIAHYLREHLRQDHAVVWLRGELIGVNTRRLQHGAVVGLVRSAWLIIYHFC